MGLPIDPPLDARSVLRASEPVPVVVRHTATNVMPESMAAEVRGLAVAWTSHAVLVRLDPVLPGDPVQERWYHARDVTRR